MAPAQRRDGVGHNRFAAFAHVGQIGFHARQRFGDRLRLLDFLQTFLSGGLSIDGDDLHLALNLVHHFLDAASALLAHLRQVPHFIRYHGKSLAMLTGARRFDGGVQCQQVRLVGDAGHGMDDFADLLRLPLQFRDHFGGIKVCLRGIAHALDQDLNIHRRTAAQPIEVIHHG